MKIKEKNTFLSGKIYDVTIFVQCIQWQTEPVVWG